jgi:hypothetical protein
LPPPIPALLPVLPMAIYVFITTGGAIFNAVTDKASPADSDHSDGRYQPGLSALSAIVKVPQDSVLLVDAATALLKLANHAPDQRIRPVLSINVGHLHPCGLGTAGRGRGWSRWLIAALLSIVYMVTNGAAVLFQHQRHDNVRRVGDQRGQGDLAAFAWAMPQRLGQQQRQQGAGGEAAGESKESPRCKSRNHYGPS